MLRIVLSLVFMLTLIGCGSTPVVSSHPRSATVNGSFDDVWEKAVRFVSTNQINVETIEKDSGLLVIGAQSMDRNTIADLCDMGNAGKPLMWSEMGGSGKGNITVVEEGGYVTATINMSFFANFGYGANRVSNPCASTGKYEDAFLNAIK